MEKKYIKDIIPTKEIEKWRRGDKILITAQTGSGKTQWVKDTLYKHCKRNGKRILLLSNRNVLRRQNENELKDKSDVITLKNYQTIETRILEHEASLDDIFRKYDYIIFDEAHYWFSDSAFNRNTDLLMGTVKRPNTSKIFVYMTATPDVLKLYHNQYEYTYPKAEDESYFKDYSFVESIYFYNSDDRAESILDYIPSGEKAIYFTSAANAYKASNRPNAAFVCSDNNEEYAQFSSKSTLKRIEEDGVFNEKILCTTTVLDTGLSISDVSVKHIILDIIDPVTLIQAIGRIRIIDGQRITLYIRNRHNGQLNFHLNQMNMILKFAFEMFQLKDEHPDDYVQRFQKKYSRKDFDNVIQNDFNVNYAKYYHTKYLKELYQRMLKDKKKIGYLRYICQLLGINENDKRIKSADIEFEKKTLSSMLKAYVGRRLYKGKEQEDFKTEFFERIFSPKKKINYRHRGLNSINSILQEDDEPYMIVTKREWKSRKPIRYWMVISTDEKDTELMSEI